MPELIDRAKLLEYLAAIKPDEYVSAYGEAAVDVINHVETYVSEMPTIEAEPVRHGRWIQSDALDYKDPNGVIHVHGMCSCCRLIYDFRDMTSRFKFCPNCGADMRGGAENG